VRTFRVLACLAVLAAVPATRASAAADEPRARRISIEYVAPTNPAHAAIYERLKERRALEMLQEIFDPVKLPLDVSIKAQGCNGVSNAWYSRPQLTICYEYIDDIRKTIPPETTEDGITPDDAMMAQFFYVTAHEMGHAVFDLLDVPIFGHTEDAADNFAAYMMLLLGKDKAWRLIGGAAYTYKDYMEHKTITVPVTDFADIHGAPMQRFYNLLCLGYGAAPDQFAGYVEKGYLPKSRARSCRMAYGEVNFAFQQLIVPHLDRALADAVMKHDWLPNPMVAVKAPGR
jgi:hypothetical protein